MHKYAIFCKSFRDDFARLARLLKSIEETNGSDIPMLISVPEHDIALLSEQINLPNFTKVIPDEQYTIEGEQFSYGWLQQQVCKLSVHRTGFAESYLMIDSDSYVINPVDRSIFYTETHPNVVYAPVSTKYEPWNDALADIILSRDSPCKLPARSGTLTGFASELAAIRAEETPDMHPDERGAFIPRLFRANNASTQPGQIFHSHILRQLEEFLADHNMSFYDAIRLSPWEYNWYGYFAACNNEEVVGVFSPIVHFASDIAISDAREKGITLALLRRHFTAIQMAARHFDTLEF